MNKWTPELEKNIRAVGDYAEEQLKILIDPAVSASGTLSKIFAKAVTTGNPLMKKTCKQAGFEFKNDWRDGLQKLSDLSDQNNSNAAAKIKKVLTAADTIMTNVKAHPGGNIEKLKSIKNQNIKFD